ncbi:hypothetical protein [Cupriavidus necator]|uniref:hypothetical protein n=1 Tax=Cupriavidus necator TaxID=106590 RepID=UPI0027802B82|nr:hypothetical protein [Cupriavidus necator]MDQ0143221.1 hypothetical protein [Cupriavidus necator]
MKNFPEAALKGFNVEAIHPDDFVVDLFDLNAEKGVAAVAGTPCVLEESTEVFFGVRAVRLWRPTRDRGRVVGGPELGECRCMPGV